MVARYISAGLLISLYHAHATVSKDEQGDGFGQHKCVGSSTQSRYCLFRNIYYDVTTKHFLLPKQHNQTVLFQSFSDVVQFPRDLVHLQSKRKKTAGEPFRVRTIPVVPDDSQIHRLSGRFMLWEEVNSGNFGHTIADNLMPIFTILYDFSFNTEWITNTNIVLKNGDVGSCESEFHRRMYSFVTNLELQCFDSLIQAKHTPLLLFETLIVGGGGYDASPTQPHPFRNHGRSAYWWKFREHALSVSKYNLSAYYRSDKKSLVVMKHKSLGSHTQKAYRIVVNTEDVIAHLRAVNPNIYTVLYDYPTLSQVEEIHLLATAAVLITPIGGLSFACPFLPKNSAVVLIGTRTHTPKNLAIGWGHNIPFVETDILWIHLSYLRVYHYVAVPTLPGQPRNTNFLVHPDRINAILWQAMHDFATDV
mmetsp:Transcript_25520/g.48261  ORF Transcript_25520/g.48261 Transcript_25520/m.48261 type:complete len:420 (-) Transcript_25520:666-1925(-)